MSCCVVLVLAHALGLHCRHLCKVLSCVLLAACGSLSCDVQGRGALRRRIASQSASPRPGVLQGFRDSSVCVCMRVVFCARAIGVCGRGRALARPPLSAHLGTRRPAVAWQQQDFRCRGRWRDAALACGAPHDACACACVLHVTHMLPRLCGVAVRLCARTCVSGTQTVAGCPRCCRHALHTTHSPTSPSI